MDDRQLLEDAARAAGVFMLEEDWPYSDPFDPQYLETSYNPAERSITGTRVWFDQHGDVGGTEEYTWNPLTDDGDALRLAAKLWLHVSHVHGKAHAGIQGRFWRTEGWFPDGDQLSATRRAIVRAAAAIGRQMREQQ